MSERFLKYETTNKYLPVDERGVLTAAGGGSSEPDIIITTSSVGGSERLHIYSKDNLKVDKFNFDYNKLSNGTLTAALCYKQFYSGITFTYMFNSTRFKYQSEGAGAGLYVVFPCNTSISDTAIQYVYININTTGEIVRVSVYTKNVDGNYIVDNYT